MGFVLILTTSGCSSSQPPVVSAQPTKSPPPKPTPALQSSTRNLGGKITFASNRDGDYEIYVMRANGQGLLQLTHNKVNDFDPAWSPDGKYIAFRRCPDRGNEIVTMSANGGNKKVVSGPDPFVDVYDPTWSPDGRRITYVMQDYEASIWWVRRDGTGEHYLASADAGMWAEDPTWTKSDRVAFTVSNESLHDAICCEDGSAQEQPPFRLDSFDHVDDPAWSWNGEWILFVSNSRTKAEPGPPRNQLFIMRAEKQAPKQLQLGDWGVRDPDWPRQAKRLAFSARLKGGFEVLITNRKATKVWRVTRARGHDVDPDWWTPDGT